MCQSRADGGKRCEYADTLSLVRRKAKYKYRNLSPSEQASKVERAVVKWKQENSAEVEKHLPERKPFQVALAPKKIPKELLDRLSTHSREPIVGRPAEQYKQKVKDLHAQRKEWIKSMSESEEHAMGIYSFTSYRGINAAVRRTGFKRLYRKDPSIRESVEKGRFKEIAQHMDSALKKAPQSEEPKRLYRYFQVPDGVSPSIFVKKYFEKGQGFKDAGYMSTSADPEFVAAQIADKNKSGKNQYVVMEILTAKGASLQPSDEAHSSSLQSMENEILLPRNTEFRIADTRLSQRFSFTSDRKDLYERFSMLNQFWGLDYERNGRFKKGEQLNYPLIQLVDESLLADN